MSEEEIRLIKGYFNDGYCCDLDELKEITNKMIDLLQQKENIIKEVRELLYKDNVKVFEYFSDDKYDYELITGKILEILDKGE